MSPLNNIFQEQRDSITRIDESVRTRTEEVFLLVFWIGDEKFATPIEKVREVVEGVPRTPLPAADEVYEGVLNLRGNLIAILAPNVVVRGPVKASLDATGGATGDAAGLDQERYVILENGNGIPFALRVAKVAKLGRPAEQVTLDSEKFAQVIDVGGEPLQLLNFCNQDGMKIFKQRSRGI
ncbi:MAG TPA: hypothetical protein DCS07_08790 [Bdellovibrionales bacterium]|nr:MAG: hypothetical protein A2Z97_11635 [Bdellovibrionales bacterium GWB1_52_6]OFZ03918.1 MAG: hypothetical protein A2X97_16120 [Bdellovibrionales bacterium GWA1_52_35]OFZ37412.1 MAG: hypothetical protein A2070_12225 [Bdellovibrionales bacterium GWC1_52_8]HAR42706.1 hypothetical protein [Bdellovibrionales bacterium]HCM39640.1 hypothetical protein [Bdellovibrionales bacterium]